MEHEDFAKGQRAFCKEFAEAMKLFNENYTAQHGQRPNGIHLAHALSVWLGEILSHAPAEDRGMAITTATIVIVRHAMDPEGFIQSQEDLH